MMDNLLVMRRNDNKIGVFHKDSKRAFVLSEENIRNIVNHVNRKEIKCCFEETSMSFIGIGKITGSKTSIKEVIRGLKEFEILK